MNWKRLVGSGLNGWAAIGLIVIVFDILAMWHEGETLTDAYRKHGTLAHVVMGVTGLHLLGVLPKKLDPYSSIAVAASLLSPSTRKALKVVVYNVETLVSEMQEAPAK